MIRKNKRSYFKPDGEDILVAVASYITMAALIVLFVLSIIFVIDQLGKLQISEYDTNAITETVCVDGSKNVGA